jgi:hypothetical protein
MGQRDEPERVLGRKWAKIIGMRKVHSWGGRGMAGGRGPLLQGPAQGKHIGRNTRSPIFLWSVRVKKTDLPLDDELAVLEVAQINAVVQLGYDFV